VDALSMTANDAVSRNYPYNCWWVAAFAAEVGRSLLARWLLDTPVLLYRTESGEVVALEDRCPHRLAPLSRGALQGDAVECGYHGFRFGPNGKCTRVPTMKAPLPISVESYPIRERGPFVWIYLGDRDCLNDVPPPPELPWATDPEFAVLSGKMDIAANYMLLKENVLDLTHFSYLHAKTFGITDWTHPPEVTTEAETVSYRQRFIECPLPAAYALPLELEPGIIWNRETYGSFVSPALQTSANDIFDPAKPGAPPMGCYRIAHATTPVDQSHMHYFWIFGRDHARSTEALEQLAKVIKQGFSEDVAILEAIQALANRSPRRGSSGERSVKADAAGVHARRMVDRWMARETIPQN
jgi:phenylpropionate dioxygenase-like ring-hydroxylating dioxygenase large terminal subunit